MMNFVNRFVAISSKMLIISQSKQILSWKVKQDKEKKKKGGHVSGFLFLGSQGFKWVQPVNDEWMVKFYQKFGKLSNLGIHSFRMVRVESNKKHTHRYLNSKVFFFSFNNLWH